jgi:hypothetical protein
MIRVLLLVVVSLFVVGCEHSIKSQKTGPLPTRGKTATEPASK